MNSRRGKNRTYNRRAKEIQKETFKEDPIDIKSSKELKLKETKETKDIKEMYKSEPIDNKNSKELKYKEPKETKKNEEIDFEYDINDENIILKAFQYFDGNQNGKINIKELRTVLSIFGNIMSEEELNKIFKFVEVDKNGNLDYKEFINFWMQNI